MKNLTNRLVGKYEFLIFSVVAALCMRFTGFVEAVEDKLFLVWIGSSCFVHSISCLFLYVKQNGIDKEAIQAYKEAIPEPVMGYAVDIMPVVVGEPFFTWNSQQITQKRVSKFLRFMLDGSILPSPSKNSVKETGYSRGWVCALYSFLSQVEMIAGSGQGRQRILVSKSGALQSIHDMCEYQDIDKVKELL